MDTTLGAALCRILGKLPALAVRQPPGRVTAASPVRRVLLIRPGGLGDMLMLIPTLRILRENFPHADIDVICEARNVDALNLAGGVANRVLTYDDHPLSCLRALRHTDYDIAIDTEQFHHFSAIFAVLSGAPVRVGFKINPLRNPLYTHLASYDPDGIEGEQFLALLHPLAISTKPFLLSGILRDASPDQIATATHPPVQIAKPYMVIHPEATTPYKHWPAERFARVGATLAEEQGLLAVIVGGTADPASCEATCQDLLRRGTQAKAVSGLTDLKSTAGVLRDAALFIGTDSGISHLAVALGVPTVVLFGPSDDRKWGTQTAGRHAVVRKDLPCAPCFIFGYHKPCRALACMQGVTVDEVLQACRTVLLHS